MSINRTLAFHAGGSQDLDLHLGIAPTSFVDGMGTLQLQSGLASPKQWGVGVS